MRIGFLIVLIPFIFLACVAYDSNGNESLAFDPRAPQWGKAKLTHEVRFRDDGVTTDTVRIVAEAELNYRSFWATPTIAATPHGAAAGVDAKNSASMLSNVVAALTGAAVGIWAKGKGLIGGVK